MLDHEKDRTAVMSEGPVPEREQQQQQQQQQPQSSDSQPIGPAAGPSDVAAGREPSRSLSPSSPLTGGSTKQSRRAVRNLSQDALAKKRLNDREAQRNIRAKTRRKIVELEQRVKELESGEAYRHLESVERHNRSLQAEVRELRRRLQQIHSDTASALGLSQATGAPQAVKDRTASHSWTHPTPPSDSTLHGQSEPSTSSATWQARVNLPSPEQMTAASPSVSGHMYAPSPVSTASVQGQIRHRSGSQTPREQMSPPMTSAQAATAPATAPAPTSGWQRADAAHGASTRSYVTHPQPHSEQEELPGALAAYQAYHRQQEHMESHPSRPVWNRMPNNAVRMDHLPHWDRHISPLIQEKRRLLAAGHSEYEVLGPRNPDFGNFYLVYRTRPDPEVPETNLSRFTIKLIRAFSPISEPPNQIGTIANVYFFLRWYISPTKENWDLMPPFLWPTQVQFEVPHPLWVDYVHWPEIRNRLCYRYQEMPIDLFHYPYSLSININWPHREGLESMLAESDLEDEKGLVTINAAFRQHNMVLDNWSLSEEFSRALPELAGTHVVRPCQRKEVEPAQRPGT